MLTYEDRKILYSNWLDFVRKNATSSEAKAQLRAWACGSANNCGMEEIDKYVKASKGALKEYIEPMELPEVAQEGDEVSLDIPSKKVKIRIRYNRTKPTNTKSREHTNEQT